ncbi:Hsp20/alpha crystallin family protein [Halocola ammonii]
MSLVKFRNRPTKPSLFDVFFDDFLDKNVTGSGGFGLMNASTPKANIREEENQYTVELAAPGYDKKDFNVEVEDNQLILSVEKTMENAEEQENFKHQEYRFESFSRSFNLPEDIDEEKIKANYHDGILKIEIPRDTKKLEEKKKRIEVA